MVDLSLWEWPQYTVVFMMLIGAGAGLFAHGKWIPRKRYNIVNDLVSNSIILLLLVAGGFFN